MKKIRGEGFSVRFTRRPSFAKKADKAADRQKERLDMQDVPDQTIEPAAKAPAAPGKMEAALWRAALDGDCYAIRVLVMEGADLEARDSQGRTAINIATQYDRKEALKTLLAAREMKRMAMLGDLPDTSFFRKFGRKKA